MDWCQWFCYFFYVIAIGYEAADKVFDGLTAIQYHKGKLFHDPKQSVYGALLAFMMIGCLVSTARICLYIWQMVRINDCTACTEFYRYYQFSVCVDAIKVIIEVFPQSIITEFAFDGCPIKTSKWKFLDIGFDVFCMASYVFFMCSMPLWYCYYKDRKKGILVHTLTGSGTAISKAGCVMALVSFVKSVKCP